MAVGGAAYLVSKAIKHAKVVGFADLGMEAIYEFDVVDMPVTVAVDAGGTSAHITGPAEWQKRIASGEFASVQSFTARKTNAPACLPPPRKRRGSCINADGAAGARRHGRAACRPCRGAACRSAAS
jgi:hypothetical protein